MAPPAEPLVGFLIGGAQKAGTSALAHYLGRHPRIRLPRDKEAHVFDAAGADWSVAAVNARYAPSFDDAAEDAVHGDATPFYLFHPACIERIAAYNPAMRWIVLLRDPAERAASQHRMERARGNEPLPLWLALLLERWRTRGDPDPFARGSRLRRYSYRARGDYARQLDTLYSHFPRGQVLVMHSDRLRRQPAACVAQACAFLGVPPPVADDAAYPPVFVGTQPPPGPVSLALLRWWMRRERRALRERHGIAFD